MGNYGGFPWPSLLKKNAQRNSDEEFLQPQYNGSGRFSQSSSSSFGTVTPNEFRSTNSPPDGESTSGTAGEGEATGGAAARETAGDAMITK